MHVLGTRNTPAIRMVTFHFGRQRVSQALTGHVAHAAQRLHLSCLDEEGAGALTACQLEGYIAALAPQLPGLAEVGMLRPPGEGSPSLVAAHEAPGRGAALPSDAADGRLQLPQDAGVPGAAAGEHPGAALGAAGSLQGAEAAPAGPPGLAGDAGDGAKRDGRSAGGAEGPGEAGACAQALDARLGEYAEFAARKLMFLHARQGRRAHLRL